MQELNIGTDLRNGLGVVIGLTIGAVAVALHNGGYATWALDGCNNTYCGHYGLTRSEAMHDMAGRINRS